MKSGISLDKIGIVSRNNYSLKLIEEELEKYNLHNTKKIQYVALISDYSVDVKPKIKTDHVTLTTVYKAKGLEWDVVFFIGCSDKFFPVETDNISIQEERRAWFVGISRAKRYLYISFTDNAITRFVKEIPRQYYNFVNYDIKYFDYNNVRNTKYDIEVTKILQMLQEKDIERMRYLNLLPNLNPQIIKIHDSTQFNDVINNYYLHADFGEFVDRYITRCLGEINPKFNGLKDRCAEKIITCVTLEAEQYDIYRKYNSNFKINIKNITKNMSEDEYIDIISTPDTNNYADTIRIKKIETNDRILVKNIISKIKTKSILCKMNISDIEVFQDNYLPNNFKDCITNSYKIYKNKKMKTNDILEDIYNVSLCGNVMNERRRLLYRNVYTDFTEDYHIMFTHIQKYLLTIKDDKLICKNVVASSKYDIVGETDLIDKSSKKIIDYKCSSSTTCKLEWILQLLTYTALYKTNNKKNSIEHIEIYNPLQGVIYLFNIKNWDKDDELLLYLSTVRDNYIAKQKTPINNNIYDTPIKNKNNNECNLFIDY